MKKFTLAAGVAIGFVAGSRAGRRPYEKLEVQLRKLAAKPVVRDTVASAGDAAHGGADAALELASERVEQVRERAWASVSHLRDAVRAKSPTRAHHGADSDHSAGTNGLGGEDEAIVE